MHSHSIELFDTSLRDGGQTAGIHFSTKDKIQIANRLAEFGITWIEGGWPGASPKDDAFFASMRSRQWHEASRLVAFGSTARPHGYTQPSDIQQDAALNALLQSGADALCIFGKAWSLHVSEALSISGEENLDLIRGSIEFLHREMPIVMFDAEHFFDGYQDDAAYAMQVLHAAVEGGASRLILCDTNGGTLPQEISRITRTVCESLPETTIGIHAHNDSELAVANSLIAISAGARHVQGTINGIGERCGNANLISIIANLSLKTQYNCGISRERLQELGSLSRFVNEMANRLPWQHQPFVGSSAFAHKGGIHVSAIRKSSALYEHIDPELVGNKQRILISDQTGKSNIISKITASSIDTGLAPDHPAVARVVQHIKEMEAQGYAYEGADGSFKLLLLKAGGRFTSHFELDAFRVIDQKQGHDGRPQAEATVQIRVGSQKAHTAALGVGPIHAIDNALRLALDRFYPQLNGMRLIDFKVRVLSTRDATSAGVRVLIESGDSSTHWGTVGVGSDVIDASYQALRDAIEYKLHIDGTPCAAR
ncbi:MAG: citramalate synthase [Mariprofundales bacterium]|nr:citramalate synthase [Mariprofundales bacterium]